MRSQKPSRRSGFLFVFVAIIALVFVLIINRQNIQDYYSAWRYQPSSSASILRDKLGLTARGKLLYDASHTAIESTKSFNQSCQQQHETNNPILGCYANWRIYVFDVTNDKLNGIEETTAAHEVLHAAYIRLPDDERRKLDDEIETVYDKIKTPELEKRVAYYEKSEPGEKYNELHSILGTEVHDLGQDLEDHYRHYFSNRQRVVDYYDSYSSVFLQVAKQLKSLETDINSRTDTINNEISTYNSDVATLNKDIQAFKAKNDASGFVTQIEFDMARAELVERQATLEQQKTSIQGEVSQVESLRKQYNGLVDQYNELNRSINSSLSPVPSI